jgi:DNA-directed RNA polymerase beta' subunit
MTTITIKINERTKAGKAFMAMSESFFKGVEGIEIVELDTTKLTKKEEKYNPEFVAKVKKAEEEIKKGNTSRLNPNDVWGSIL